MPLPAQNPCPLHGQHCSVFVYTNYVPSGAVTITLCPWTSRGTNAVDLSCVHPIPCFSNRCAVLGCTRLQIVDDTLVAEHYPLFSSANVVKSLTPEQTYGTLWPPFAYLSRTPRPFLNDDHGQGSAARGGERVARPPPRHREHSQGKGGEGACPGAVGCAVGFYSSAGRACENICIKSGVGTPFVCLTHPSHIRLFPFEVVTIGHNCNRAAWCEIESSAPALKRRGRSCHRGLCFTHRTALQIFRRHGDNPLVVGSSVIGDQNARHNNTHPVLWQSSPAEL